MTEIDRPPFWNIWWTLMVISAAFTAIVLVLEAFGVFHDLGFVLSGLGLLLTIGFGFGASSRSFLLEFRGDVVPRLDGLRASVLALDRAADGANERLERLDLRLERLDIRFDRLETTASGTNDRLDRVITLLDERLPRPRA